MLGIAASLLTLLAAVLFYLTDREQRWLDHPLPGLLRLGVVLLLAVSAGLWVLLLGPGVGLMVGLWGLLLALLVLTLLAGHQQDSFQKAERRS